MTICKAYICRKKPFHEHRIVLWARPKKTMVVNSRPLNYSQVLWIRPSKEPVTVGAQAASLLDLNFPTLGIVSVYGNFLEINEKKNIFHIREILGFIH